MLALLDQGQGPFVANDAEATIAKAAADKLRTVATSGHDIKITIQGQAEIIVPLPARAVDLIFRILETMGEGVPISVIPHHAELTTQQAADYLNVRIGLGLTTTSVLMSAILAGALVWQFAQKKYVPASYWLSVVLISIVGTLITDSLVDTYGVKLETTTILFALALIVTFAAWYLSEKTLSVHTIYTVKREIYYWVAILFTFALGTAAGDLVGERWQLGYVVSGLIFAGLIACVAVSYYVFKANAVAAFWMAYILTRPLGASFGDYLSQPVANGGLGLGTSNTSIVFLLIILGLLAFSSLGRKPLAISAD